MLKLYFILYSEYYIIDSINLSHPSLNKFPHSFEYPTIKLSFYMNFCLDVIVCLRKLSLGKMNTVLIRVLVIR